MFLLWALSLILYHRVGDLSNLQALLIHCKKDRRFSRPQPGWEIPGKTANLFLQCGGLFPVRQSVIYPFFKVNFFIGILMMVYSILMTVGDFAQLEHSIYIGNLVDYLLFAWGASRDQCLPTNDCRLFDQWPCILRTISDLTHGTWSIIILIQTASGGLYILLRTFEKIDW